jgi:hypothetical protein
MKKIFLVAAAFLSALPMISLPVSASEGDRLQRALDWPTVNLENYDNLYIEDVKITDPLAAERKIRNLVETAPKRMANFIAFSVDKDLFPAIHRKSPEPGAEGLIVRVNLPQYKPGSAAARTLLAGTGAAHLNIEVILLDASSGSEIAAFTENRTFAWGGLVGGTRGITLMEENAAKEIAAWLSLGKGVDHKTILSKMKNVAVAGPPEKPHGTIYILRPQSMVGGASRFRVGINDMTIGESKRKRYYLIYVPPGEHQVWWGSDKKKKRKPVTVEVGGEYYFEAMGMKQIPSRKGENKLKQCKLSREIDYTSFQ